jgi:hypothetical protein
MNLAVKCNLLKDTQPHYIYKPESCLENDNYKLCFDRTVLTDIHIQHNRPDIIILNKQQKQAYLLDIDVPNSHNITQTYNTKFNKYLVLSVAMRNLWCLKKNSILPLIISATGIVLQSLFKNLKILDLENTLVVEIQKSAVANDTCVFATCTHFTYIIVIFEYFLTTTNALFHGNFQKSLNST